MTQTFLSRILAEKAKEVETMATEELQPLRDTYKLYDYLKSHPKQLQVIAEVKKASPSFGDINLDVAIDQQAKCYQENGAAMISVLTDPHFFKGSIEDLRQVSSQVRIPTLAGVEIIQHGKQKNPQAYEKHQKKYPYTKGASTTHCARLLSEAASPETR